jgi:DNA-binding NtrC family response regulator
MKSIPAGTSIAIDRMGERLITSSGSPLSGTGMGLQIRFSIKERYEFGNIISESPAMQEVYELILKAAAMNAAESINGESANGKELVAWALYDMSDRRDRAR